MLFDAESYEEERIDFVPGNYTVKVEDADVRDTKSGTGQYINVRFSIVGSDSHGLNFFELFNIKNDNAKAVSIGLNALKAMLTSAGNPNMKVRTASDLVGLTCYATLTLKVDDYGEKIVVKKFIPAEPEEKTNNAGF